MWGRSYTDQKEKIYDSHIIRARSFALLLDSKSFIPKIDSKLTNTIVLLVIAISKAHYAALDRFCTVGIFVCQGGPGYCSILSHWANKARVGPFLNSRPVGRQVPLKNAKDFARFLFHLHHLLGQP